MEITKKPLPILSVCGMKDRIDTSPDFQRPAVWGKSQKQLLIDSILRGYDIPKFYLRKTSSKPDKFDVVDGQQRLRTIFEYHNEDFALAKDADPVESEQIKGMHYGDLPLDLRMQLDNYPLDVVILSETDEDGVREMFLRLQNGTTLKAQEKRNAMRGKMRNFVRELAGSPFFHNCGFKNTRFNFDLVAAQMIAIELNGGPCHVRNTNLSKMYESERDFDSNSAKAKKLLRVLEFLTKAFPAKTPELERYSVVSLYALVSHCLEGYVMQHRHRDLHDWFISFETERRKEDDLDEDAREPELLAYKERTSHSTDAQDSIQWRHDFLLRKFFEAVPDIRIKDDQRMFTHEQRMAIYRRDGGRCQLKIKCKGAKCTWDKWHADHRTPWSKGGKTTVENGLLACPTCNATKGNKH